MKAFVVYTLARLGLFLAVYGLIWLFLFRNVQWNAVSALYTALIAVVVSSLLALVALRRQRAALAAQLAKRSKEPASRYGVARPPASAQRGQDQAGESTGGVAELGQPGGPENGDQR